MRKTIWLYSLLAAALVISSAGLGWADVKPGDTVTKENMAQAEDLLIPLTRWMVNHGMPMKVIETRHYEWPKAYKEATEKYSGQVKLSEDGREMFNYVAGAPFPSIDINDPLAGYKVMWNVQQKPYYIDNVGTEWIVELINVKGEIERTYGSAFWRRMMWTGRLYNDPKPVVPHNPPLRYTEQWGPVFIPNDLKGAGTLNMQYLPADVPDDSYMYLPELRRVRRLSVSNRSDAFWGTDYDIDSIWAWNAKIGYWNFRVLAHKQILELVRSGKYGDRSIWCAPRDGQHGFVAALPCTKWEKRWVWIVEGVPTGYSQYAYGKKIVYADEEMLGNPMLENYDQGGELWKYFFNVFDITKKPYDGYPSRPLEGAKYNYTDEWFFAPNGMMGDVQLNHASPWDAPSGYTKPADWRNEWYFNESVRINTPETFTISYLIQSAR